jgi:hypothetical protein
VLPFTKNQNDQSKSFGTIVKKRAPASPGKLLDMAEMAVLDCSMDILRAIHEKDPKALASALKDVFEILDSQPHEEGPHINPHSYDAQKE